MKTNEYYSSDDYSHYLHDFSDDMLDKQKEGIRMKLYEAMIPLDPKTKKNNQRILYNTKTKKPFIQQSSTYKRYERDAGWFLKKLPQPISEPVNVKCIFYREKEIRCDLTNLLEAILDILRVHGIIDDDNRNIVYSVDGSRVLCDRENPRTEITITTVEDFQEWAKKSK